MDYKIILPICITVMNTLIISSCNCDSIAKTHAANKITIVKQSNAPWLINHAASELARYIKALTNQDAAITTKQIEATEDNIVIDLLVGPTADCLKDLSGADNIERLRDGYVIRSIDKNHLQISALEPIGLLYGVYDYLERYCDVGFFWEGDYIPKLTQLPVNNISCMEIPRWQMREMLIWGTFGISKYHNHYRSKEQIEKITDWMVKNRYNSSRYDFSADIAHSGEPAVDIFDINDKIPDNFTYAGWPGTLDIPANMVTKNLQDWFDYSRKRGITWIYNISGDVPHQWREMHPDYKYLNNLGYSATTIDPSDPHYIPIMQAFYKSIIKTYGTDHIYMNTPLCESMGADTPEASYLLKLAAAKKLVENLKTVDRDAIWQWDTWDFLAVPQVWTTEHKKMYIESFTGEKMLIYDTAGESVPQYKDSNYFSGADWQFGILHSFQGDDHLHGNFTDYIKRIQELSKDPKANKCVGINLVPESTGHNLMFFDLVAKSAWNPDKITVDSFLRDRAIHRYGHADSIKMYEAMKSLVKAVYSGGGRLPIYKKLGCQYGPVDWWPIVGDRMKDTTCESIYSDIYDLHETIQLGLSCRDTQRNNELYVIDMADWTRTYLAHIFNWAMIDVFKALERGDTNRLQSSSEIARICMTGIENIMATCPDFHLQPQIDRYMSIPRTNPYNPWYMKQHCINDLYSANDVYEQMHWFYKPRVEVYLNECANRVRQGVKTINWSDIEGKCNDIRTRWLNEDIRIPASETFQGSTMEAVAAAFESMKDFINNRSTGDANSSGNSIYSLRDLGNVNN